MFPIKTGGKGGGIFKFGTNQRNRHIQRQQSEITVSVPKGNVVPVTEAERQSAGNSISTTSAERRAEIIDIEGYNVVDVQTQLTRKELQLLMGSYRSTESSLDMLIPAYLSFTVYSSEEIIRDAVVQITTAELQDKETKKIKKGGLYDPRMGVITDSGLCATCNKDSQSCPGHFGVIILKRPVINSVYQTPLFHVLNSVCKSCGDMIISEQEIIDAGLHQLKGLERLTAIANRSAGRPCRGQKPGKPPGQCESVTYLPGYYKTTGNVYYKIKGSKTALDMKTTEVLALLNLIGRIDPSIYLKRRISEFTGSQKLGKIYSAMTLIHDSDIAALLVSLNTYGSDFTNPQRPEKAESKLKSIFSSISELTNDELEEFLNHIEIAIKNKTADYRWLSATTGSTNVVPLYRSLAKLPFNDLSTAIAEINGRLTDDSLETSREEFNAAANQATDDLQSLYTAVGNLNSDDYESLLAVATVIAKAKVTTEAAKNMIVSAERRLAGPLRNIFTLIRNSSNVSDVVHEIAEIRSKAGQREMLENAAITTTDPEKKEIYDAIINLSEDDSWRVIGILYEFDTLRPFDEHLLGLLGFTDGTHPKDFIFTAFPIVPPIDRGRAQRGDRIEPDGLTQRYKAIFNQNATVAANIAHETASKAKERSTRLGTSYEDELRKENLSSASLLGTITSPKIEISLGNLAKAINELVRDSEGGGNDFSGNFKSLVREIQGKKGDVRRSLMGKRVDYAARSTIAIDPTIDLGEVGVPRKIAETLTIPVVVTRENRHELREMLKRGQIKTWTRGGGKLKDIAVPITDANREKYAGGLPAIGDKLHRKLRNGDPAMFNRQPTQGRGSFMGHSIRIVDGLAFRMNIAETGTYNADFDGDEMNLHIPQTDDAILEAKTIASTIACMRSDAVNAPVMSLMYDSLTACHILTMPDIVTYERINPAEDLPKRLVQPSVKITIFNKSLVKVVQPSIKVSAHVFDNALLSLEGKRFSLEEERPGVPEHLLSFRKRLELAGHKQDSEGNWSGHAYFSIALPEKLYYSKKGVEIRNGILVSGQITEDHIAAKRSGTITDTIILDFGPERAAKFLDDAKKILGYWLATFGFTINLDDCIPGDRIISLEKGITRITSEDELMSFETYASIWRFLSNRPQRGSFDRRAVASGQKVPIPNEPDPTKRFPISGRLALSMIFPETLNYTRDTIRIEDQEIKVGNLNNKMVVDRIASELGIREGAKFAKELGEYEFPPNFIYVEQFSIQSGIIEKTSKGEMTPEDLTAVISIIKSGAEISAKQAASKTDNDGERKVLLETPQLLADELLRDGSKLVSEWLLKDKGEDFKYAVKSTVDAVRAFVRAADGRIDDPIEREMTEREILPQLRRVQALNKEAEDTLSPFNNIKLSKNAGTKGNIATFGQLMVGSGQQWSYGARIKPGMSNNTRVMAFNEPHDTDPKAKGFITTTLVEGYTPQDMVEHLSATRIANIDLAVQAPTAGDAKRNLTKAVGDLIVYMDGTVRTDQGDIVQFVYGENGWDGSKLENTNIGSTGYPNVVDFGRLIGQLNYEYEHPV